MAVLLNAPDESLTQAYVDKPKLLELGYDLRMEYTADLIHDMGQYEFAKFRNDLISNITKGDIDPEDPEQMATFYSRLVAGEYNEAVKIQFKQNPRKLSVHALPPLVAQLASINGTATEKVQTPTHRYAQVILKASIGTSDDKVTNLNVANKEMNVLFQRGPDLISSILTEDHITALYNKYPDLVSFFNEVHDILLAAGDQYRSERSIDSAANYLKGAYLVAEVLYPDALKRFLALKSLADAGSYFSNPMAVSENRATWPKLVRLISAAGKSRFGATSLLEDRLDEYQSSLLSLNMTVGETLKKKNKLRKDIHDAYPDVFM